MTLRNTWFYALFIALLYTVVYGYLFNSGDQAEHLPQVYHKLNPTLYQGDFFIGEYMKGFTIRYYYVFIVTLFSRFISTEWVCFILHIFTLAFSAFGIFKITQTLSTSKLAPFVAPILALIVFRNLTVGGNAVHEVQFISSSLAWPLVTWAFFKLLKEKYIAATAFAGFAVLSQPLIGLQAFLIIFGIVVIRGKRIFFGTIIYSFIAFFAASVLMLSPLILRQFLTQGNADNPLYMQLLYGFRNYHHYIPHLFPRLDYIKFIILITLGGILLFRQKTSEAKTIKILFGLIIAGLLFYTYCMETQTFYGIGKLQWFKTTVWLTLFSSVFVAIAFSSWIEKISPPLFGRGGRGVRLMFPLVSVALLIFLTNTALITDTHEKYQIGNYVKSDRTKLFQWVEKNTATNAVVLVSPDDDSFACIAKRPQPVSFKAIIHEPKFMLKWYDRVKQIYGITVEECIDKNAGQMASSLYKERNYKEHITQAINITYRIDNLQTCQYATNLGVIIHQEGDWVLTVF